MLTKNQIVGWLRHSAKVMKEKSSYLSELDAVIGDGDHGINMERGFKKVLEKLETDEQQDIAAVLRETGMALISSVGGASGPLYGTFFITAGANLSGKTQVSTDDLAASFRAGADALAQRGRALEGDKTIVDALMPAVRALEQAAGAGESVHNALNKAAQATQQGMEKTIEMTARKGRASYLGERSVGHQDPGASSAYLLLKALCEAAS